jgi:hypothetical protein
MRVQFTYDKEDMVDANLRFLRRSKTIKSARWQGMLFTALLCWGLFYVVFMLLLKNPYLFVITAVVMGVAIIALYPLTYENGIRKRLRKLFDEQLADQNTFTCEVELTPEEVRITQDRSRNVYDWKSVGDIVVTNDSVDLFLPMGDLVIRNRAFASSGAREEFIDLARSYLAASRSKTDGPIRSNDA